MNLKNHYFVTSKENFGSDTDYQRKLKIIRGGVKRKPGIYLVSRHFTQISH